VTHWLLVACGFACVSGTVLVLGVLLYDWWMQPQGWKRWDR
jgi:hypothetical protein